MAEVSFETSGETSALATHSTQALATLLEQVAKEDADGSTRFKYEIKVSYDKPDEIVDAPIEPTEEEENVQSKTNKRNKNGRNKSADGELREGGEEESSQ